jgi:hypothetical protein
MLTFVTNKDAISFLALVNIAYANFEKREILQ